MLRIYDYTGKTLVYEFNNYQNPFALEVTDSGINVVEKTDADIDFIETFKPVCQAPYTFSGLISANKLAMNKFGSSVNVGDTIVEPNRSAISDIDYVFRINEAAYVCGTWTFRPISEMDFTSFIDHCPSERIDLSDGRYKIVYKTSLPGFCYKRNGEVPLAPDGSPYVYSSPFYVEFFYSSDGVFKYTGIEFYTYNQLGGMSEGNHCGQFNDNNTLPARNPQESELNPFYNIHEGGSFDSNITGAMRFGSSHKRVDRYFYDWLSTNGYDQSLHSSLTIYTEDGATELFKDDRFFTDVGYRGIIPLPSGIDVIYGLSINYGDGAWSKNGDSAFRELYKYANYNRNYRLACYSGNDLLFNSSHVIDIIGRILDKGGVNSKSTNLVSLLDEAHENDVYLSSDGRTVGICTFGAKNSNIPSEKDNVSQTYITYDTSTGLSMISIRGEPTPNTVPYDKLGGAVIYIDITTQAVYLRVGDAFSKIADNGLSLRVIESPSKYHIIQTSTLTNIADSIRFKRETTEPIKVSDYAEEIRNIDSLPTSEIATDDDIDDIVDSDMVIEESADENVATYEDIDAIVDSI